MDEERFIIYCRILGRIFRMYMLNRIDLAWVGHDEVEVVGRVGGRR